MMSPIRRSHSGRALSAVAAVLAIAAAVVLTVAFSSQQHAPQPPASAARPAAEQSVGPSGRPSTAGTRATAAAPHTVGPVLPRSAPVTLDVPSIGISHAPLARYGLDGKGAIAIPPSRAHTPAGWYTGSPTPGQPGPSVIVGHVDSDSGPSVFFRLGKLRPGDRASVTRADHTVAVFEVDSVERFAKADFPTLRVYGNLDYAGLRLITCGGPYDTSVHHYTDNIVVYAHLVSSHPADVPSAAAMVCSAELGHSIAALLGLPATPRGRPTWTGRLYTCRYDLPAGRLVLTVQESADDAAAENYLAAQRRSFPHARPVTGLASLGLPAFETPAGITAFAKDNFTLVVDASHLSGPLGKRGSTPGDFAYAVATDVLACWSS